VAEECSDVKTTEKRTDAVRRKTIVRPPPKSSPTWSVWAPGQRGGGMGAGRSRLAITSSDWTGSPAVLVQRRAYGQFNLDMNTGFNLTAAPTATP
jgi:hypothetical protein